MVISFYWWTIKDSNLGPTGYEPVALTNWANGPYKILLFLRIILLFGAKPKTLVLRTTLDCVKPPRSNLRAARLCKHRLARAWLSRFTIVADKYVYIVNKRGKTKKYFYHEDIQMQSKQKWISQKVFFPWKRLSQNFETASFRSV